MASGKTISSVAIGVGLLDNFTPNYAKLKRSFNSLRTDSEKYRQTMGEVNVAIQKTREEMKKEGADVDKLARRLRELREVRNRLQDPTSIKTASVEEKRAKDARSLIDARKTKEEAEAQAELNRRIKLAGKLLNEQVRKDQARIVQEEAEAQAELNRRIKMAGKLLNDQVRKDNARTVQEEAEAQAELNRRIKLAGKLLNEQVRKDQARIVQEEAEAQAELNRRIKMAGDLLNKQVREQERLDGLAEGIARNNETANERMIRKLRELDMVYKKTTLSAEAYRREQQRIVAESKKATSGLGRFKGVLSLIRNDIASTLIAAVGLREAFNFFRESIRLSAEVQASAAALEVFTGSASKARDILSELREFAASSPVSFAGAQRAARTLLQFGVEAEKVTGLVKQLGEVTGGSEERLEKLSLAFAQVAAAGKFQGQEVLQAVNAGFNPLLIISRKTGQSMQELRDQMRAGQLDASLFGEALAIATSEGGQFEGLLSKIEETTAGKLAKAQSKFQEFQITVGDSLDIGPFVDMFTDDMTQVIESVEILRSLSRFNSAGLAGGIAEENSNLPKFLSDTVDGLGQIGDAASNANNSVGILATALTALRDLAKLPSNIKAAAEVFSFSGDINAVSDLQEINLETAQLARNLDKLSRTNLSGLFSEDQLNDSKAYLKEFERISKIAERLREGQSVNLFAEEDVRRARALNAELQKLEDTRKKLSDTATQLLTDAANADIAKLNENGTTIEELQKILEIRVKLREEIGRGRFTSADNATLDTFVEQQKALTDLEKEIERKAGMIDKAFTEPLRAAQDEINKAKLGTDFSGVLASLSEGDAKKVQDVLDESVSLLEAQNLLMDWFGDNPLGLEDAAQLDMALGKYQELNALRAEAARVAEEAAEKERIRANATKDLSSLEKELELNKEILNSINLGLDFGRAKEFAEDLQLIESIVGADQSLALAQDILDKRSELAKVEAVLAGKKRIDALLDEFQLQADILRLGKEKAEIEQLKSQGVDPQDAREIVELQKEIDRLRKEQQFKEDIERRGEEVRRSLDPRSDLVSKLAEIALLFQQGQLTAQQAEAARGQLLADTVRNSGAFLQKTAPVVEKGSQEAIKAITGQQVDQQKRIYEETKKQTVLQQTANRVQQEVRDALRELKLPGRIGN